MLRSLRDRPNVQSTLILSRRNGSIVTSSGFGSADKRRRAESMAGYQVQSNDKSQHDSQEGLEQQVRIEKLSAEQELATSIFQFVQAADALGSTLDSVSAEQGSDEYTTHRNDDVSKDSANKDATAVSDEAHVQLLRLRVKHYEIIIFPDPRYLCCVVQRVGRLSTSAR